MKHNIVSHYKLHCHLSTTVACVLQLDASFMAAMPDDIRDEIKSAYCQGTVTKPPSTAQSPEKSLHPLMRLEVNFTLSFMFKSFTADVF